MIRNALVEAVADLRRNAWLLDFVFAGLPQDALTANLYGLKEVREAKRWFLSTNVPVVLNVNPNALKFPCISIQLAASAEDKETLADTHYQPEEPVASEWPVLAGPLTPTDYVPATGTIVFDPSQLGFDADGLNGLILVEGMVVVDAVGNKWPILNVVDYRTVQIQPSVVANFSGCSIRSAEPGLIANVESNVFRETYVIGCHVQSEPVWLVYLHSVVLFCLLRYKQALLEGRGFEVSTLSSSDFAKNRFFSDAESVYSRFITINGLVRQVWPKLVTAPVTSATFQPQIMGAGAAFPTATTAQLQDQAWIGEGDADPWQDLESDDVDILARRLPRGQ